MEKDRYRPILNNAVFPDTTPEQARADVAWYKQCGYGGFAINGSTRQPVENLQEWLTGYLAACRNYVQAAKEQDMNVWIFDEWGYPSGTACGQVLTEERFRAKKYRICYDVRLEPGQSICLPLTERFVSACVFPVDYFGFYCPKDRGQRLFPQDGQLCYTAGEPSRLIAVDWEYLTFITHVMKKHEPGDPTIGTIDILMKEAVARFLQCMHEWYVEPLGEEFGKTIQGFFYDEPEICYDFPYTEELPGAFSRQHGYPLEEILPELLAWRSSSALISVNDSMQRLQREYADYCHTWNDLLARNFYGQIREWCHAHGLLSIGHQDLDNQLETLRTVSGDFWENSRYNDRPGIDVIWDQIAPDKFADFARYAGCAKRTNKTTGAISETFAEMGPSMYPDRMRYTMEQQILRGVDQFFLYTNHSPEDLNVKYFAAAVNDRVTRTARLCNQGKPGAKTAIYVPMDDIAFFAANSDPHLHNSDPQAWKRVDGLAQQLCYHPMDYDYAWQGTLDTLKERGIATLLLAAQTDMTKQDQEAARSFAAAGGCIVSIGKPCEPLEDIAVYYPTAAAWLIQQKGELAIRGLDGVSPKISLTRRLLEDKVLIFLLNESDSPVRIAVNAAEGSWQQLMQESGSWQPANMQEPIIFHARELKIFSLTQKGEVQQPAYRHGTPVTLGDWQFTGPDGTTQPLPALLPWTQLGLGDYTGFASYETAFDWEGGLCELDLGEVRFAAIAQLDQETILLPMAPYRIQRVLSAGHHTLRVRILNSNANRIYAGEDTGRSNFNGQYWMLYQFERAYRDCGLLGPVQITPLYETAE